ncbi:alpha/beta hydrolase [Weissella diestrammenae]|uniref:Alpha/beta hydrolase n=1 Tax=Weissella diestrammenae TaxID=1162633 RepID=A0A7G9T5N9_9LACO|nr:alpha/beta hydrolase [Weissella diestrammenae]MCM0582240.1 alpha/beta hydrolase [Weissella diestrammenae]QNN75414.1 alpha/beta hydrolase [Weissella diestrammenae]
MSFFQTNDGVKLHYQVSGQTGIPIVFVGGYTSNIATWAAQIPTFVAAGYRVIRFEFRNHGESQIVDYGLKISRLTMDLQLLIRHLNLKKFVLIGHSMGAMVIGEYMSLFDTGNVLAVVTEDQPPKMLNDATWQSGIADSSFRSIDQIADDFPKQRLIHQPIQPELKQVITSHYQPFDFALNRPLLIDGIVQDWRDSLRIERVPHFFLAGDASPLYPVRHLQDAVALHQRATAEMYTFNSVGHIPHLEQPDEYNRVVLSFLKQLY